MNKVYAIIVTYNPDMEMLKRQNQSLFHQVDGIVYIDNGSEDQAGLGCLLKNFIGQVQVYFNLANQGLGKAQNQGIRVALRQGATHVLLLDHDSVLLDGFVANLLEGEVRTLALNYKIGAVGPVFYDESRGIQYPISVYGMLNIKKIYPHQEDMFASFIIASGSLIRKEVLEDVGLMNEGLFVDMVDNEWCARASAKGYKLLVTPRAKMYHKIGDRRMTFLGMNISYHGPLRRYYLCRNCVHGLHFRGIPFFIRVRTLGLSILRMLIMVLTQEKRRIYLKYCLRGFWDGDRGIYGECPIKDEESKHLN